MASYDDLDPHLQCYALVGRYFQTFANMEAELDKSIAAVLKLTNIQRAILSKNIVLRNKVNIARTLINLSSLSPEKMAMYQATLDNIGTMGGKRNMVVHDYFRVPENGRGADFLVVHAKSRLNLPETIWSPDDFDREYDAMHVIADSLASLRSDLRTLDIAKLLTDPPPNSALSPIAGLFGLGSANLPIPPGPGILNSLWNAANPETAPETPPSDPVKPDQPSS